MTPDEFNEICRTVCPHCRDGHQATQRADTQEWQHVSHGTQIKIALCWASGFRNSRFAPKDGS